MILKNPMKSTLTAGVEHFADAFWDSFNNDLAKGALDVYLENWDKQAERITPTVHARGIDEIRAADLHGYERVRALVL